jgi:hypothetical protein
MLCLLFHEAAGRDARTRSSAARRTAFEQANQKNCAEAKLKIWTFC